MINIAKYFALLEELTFDNVQASQKKTFAIPLANLRILSKYVQLDVDQQLQELCLALDATPTTIDTENSISCYIIRLLHVLHTLRTHINFDSDAKEDLISVAHLKLCIQTTQELAYYALRCQLHDDFYNSPVFKETPHNADVRCSSSLVVLSVRFLVQLLSVRQLHIANAMELVQRDLLAAVIGLCVQQPLEQRAQLAAALAYLWTNESKADYFRHVLLLKATPQLGAPLARALHLQLLSKLGAPHGFASLLAALHTSNATRNAEIVANIVAQRGYSLRLQQRLIEQIFDFCRLQLTHVDSLLAGVLSLRRLHELNLQNREQIELELSKHWLPLTAPQDLLNGLIVWEQAELCALIQLWQQLFCSSSVACLPSALLIPYLPLLLRLYQQLPDRLPERKSLASLVSRCLDNRAPEQELPELLQRLFSWPAKTDSPPWQALHPRVALVPCPKSELITVQVAHEQPVDNPCRVLSALLMSGSDQSLTAKVFLALLSLMLHQLATTRPASVELLATEAELAQFLDGKYQLQLELLLALEQLVWHEPLKAQLASTQSQQFMQLVADLLAQQLDAKMEPAQQAEQTLLLMLLLLQELLERSEQLHLAESTRRLLQPLDELSIQTQSPMLKNALLPLLGLLNGERQPSAQDASLTPFQRARELIEDRQPHLQVYGIQLMMEALRQKDPVFISQAPRIIALALSTLKNKESYTFLNCVRLFVALVYVMESQVLDMLSDEYLSETAELDYRLVVGEAILKAAQEIGPLCYRYKAVLFNCFLHGARSPLDEFRSSAYSNLAQLCRLLAYHVHSFFQELLQLIDTELSSGRYVPAKRGALLVLADLLAGMESLLDYQDMLLPIYRLLRVIEAAESCDPQMRQHAANGLKILNEKCRELLSTEPNVNQLQREIKVLGIKERHILELN